MTATRRNSVVNRHGSLKNTEVVSGTCCKFFKELCDQRYRFPAIIPVNISILGDEMFRAKNWADWSNAFGDELAFGCLPRSAYVYRTQARWLLNELRIREFNPASVNARVTLINMLREWVTSVVKATILCRLTRLRRFFKFVNSVLPDTFSQEVFAVLIVPKGAKKAPMPTALSERDAVKVLAAARTFTTKAFPEMHMYTYICFGMMMGLRPAEILHLDWSELDLSAKPAVLGLRELPTRRLKNDLAAQRLTIPPEITFMLREFFEVKQSGPLFRGGQTYAFEKLRAVSGVKNLNTHILRRTAITNWFLAGIDLKLLTILSRHANPVILYKHYLARPEIADIYSGLPFNLS